MEPRAGFGPAKISPPQSSGEIFTHPFLKIDDIEEEIEAFRGFLRIKKNLTRKVVNGHCNTIKRFLYSYQGILSPETIEGYLKGIKERWSTKTYANHLGSFKRYTRDFKGLDYVEDYDFPTIVLEPIIIPSKEDIITFYEAIPDTKYTAKNERKTEPKYKALFLLLASSGLRLGEALALRKMDLVVMDRMILPRNSHETNTTKKAWITFYNRETEEHMKWLKALEPEDRIFPSIGCVYDAFNLVREATQIDITPQKLREWFCEEMGNLGVPDRYIDAFCGRIPNSILSRRYTDYSPKKLKAIYKRANLRVLE